MTIQDAISLQKLKIKGLQLKSKKVKIAFYSSIDKDSKKYNSTLLAQTDALLSDANQELGALELLIPEIQ